MLICVYRAISPSLPLKIARAAVRCLLLAENRSVFAPRLLNFPTRSGPVTSNVPYTDQSAMLDSLKVMFQKETAPPGYIHSKQDLHKLFLSSAMVFLQPSS